MSIVIFFLTNKTGEKKELVLHLIISSRVLEVIVLFHFLFLFFEKGDNGMVLHSPELNLEAIICEER